MCDIVIQIVDVYFSSALAEKEGFKRFPPKPINHLTQLLTYTVDDQGASAFVQSPGGQSCMKKASVIR